MALFVFEDRRLHLLTRGSAILAAIVLIGKGEVYNDSQISAIGWTTLIFDAYTFYLTTQKLSQ